MISVIVLAAVVAAVVVAARRHTDGFAPGFLGGSATSHGSAARRVPLGVHLDEWVAAGLIDAAQAEAVLAHEREQGSEARGRVPLVAEAVGYIGAGLVLAAVALLVGNHWQAMGAPARIGAVAVPTAAAMAAGWWTGHDEEGALRRLGAVLWLLGVAGTAGVGAEVWVDAIHDGDPPTHHAALFIGSWALVAAAPTWWARRTELQQVALLGATIATSVGAADSLGAGTDHPLSPGVAGFVLVVIGTAWIAAASRRLLTPVLLANLSGAVLALFGAQIVRGDGSEAGLWLGLTVSIALMTTGVARSALELLFVGAAGLFQWTPQIALHYLEDTLGAEATLFVIGSLLIVLAGVFTRIYPLALARRDGSAARDR